MKANARITERPYLAPAAAAVFVVLVFLHDGVVGRTRPSARHGELGAKLK